MSLFNFYLGKKKDLFVKTAARVLTVLEFGGEIT